MKHKEPYEYPSKKEMDKAKRFYDKKSNTFTDQYGQEYSVAGDVIELLGESYDRFCIAFDQEIFSGQR